MKPSRSRYARTTSCTHGSSSMIRIRSFMMPLESRAPSDTEDVRRGNRPALEGKAPAALHGESGRADGRFGVAGGVAAASDSRVDVPVVGALPDRSGARVAGTHVLVEAKLAAGAQDAAQLGQRARLVGDAAQHERRDGGVEALVRERTPVSDGVDNGHEDRRAAGGRLDALAQ